MPAVRSPAGHSAPVVVRHEIEIHAGIAAVWQLHVNVNAWPTWQNDITAARLEGAFEPGTSFDWTSNGFSVTSTIYDVVEQARVPWGGLANGITGLHEWLFTPTPRACTS